MTTAATYNLLSATIAFREAYKNLQAAYDQIDDADFSAQYPLGQIDIFDKNTRDGLVAWLNCHSTKLINSLPDKVINPTCIECLRNSQDKYPKLDATGTCIIKQRSPACFSYPYVTFDADMIRAFLIRQTYVRDVTSTTENIRSWDDSALRTMYYKVLTAIGLVDNSH